MKSVLRIGSPAVTVELTAEEVATNEVHRTTYPINSGKQAKLDRLQELDGKLRRDSEDIALAGGIVLPTMLETIRVEKETLRAELAVL